ncbi:MAG: UvrD-helicase domain-containing protein [Gemmatimonadetes bacterium]|nr:UvrD-helicase domain-containing protein [Gemmatimonadota bacterium]
MIVWTRDLLAGDAGIRAAIRRRIRMLIVDEFQDVDPIQREIAYLLGIPRRAIPPPPASCSWATRSRASTASAAPT